MVGKDIPVIVLTKTIKQIAKGHYRVVIGFDDDEDQIIFHDPYFGDRQAMTSEDFMKVWELGKGRNQSRWMMAVVIGDRGELVRNEQVISFIKAEVDRATPALAPYEKIRRIVLLEREFEIEKDEITPSLKIKRNIIEDRYRDLIDDLYREDGGL